MKFDIPKNSSRHSTLEWLTSYNLKPIINEARTQDVKSFSIDFDRYRDERKTLTQDWFRVNLTKN